MFDETIQHQRLDRKKYNHYLNSLQWIVFASGERVSCNTKHGVRNNCVYFSTACAIRDGQWVAFSIFTSQASVKLRKALNRNKFWGFQMCIKYQHKSSRRNCSDFAVQRNLLWISIPKPPYPQWGGNSIWKYFRKRLHITEEEINSLKLAKEEWEGLESPSSWGCPAEAGGLLELEDSV